MDECSLAVRFLVSCQRRGGHLGEAFDFAGVSVLGGVDPHELPAEGV
jgi:hypothetical protein